MKKIILLIVVIGIVAGIAGGWWYFNKNKTKNVTFRTTEVTRGDILSTISATGTVEPEELVDVGAQVAGLIIAFGKDEDGNEIDYGSPVAENTVLAKIDDTSYAADVALATAQLEQAKAGVESSKANLLQLKAKLDQARLDWERAQKLGPSEALAKSSYDSYKAAFEVAQANVAVGEAAILEAKASVSQDEAMLQKAKLNLGYCTIKSPVEGVIIDRRVNIGQTVVSSLNTPSLFLIAKDLKRMQVWVSVNEADIGKIYEGQPVTFTVSTYEGQTFKGVVGQIRLNATMTQNVVTYTVEVDTDNSSGKLLPYLTANVNFEVSRRDNVLEVTNAALRWKPRAEQIAPEYQSALNDSAEQGKGSGKKQRDPNAPKTQTSNYKKATLWVSENGFVKPIKVLAGTSDDTVTEVQGVASQDELKEGLQVITGEQQMSGGSSGTVNPFTPQIGRPRPAGR
ncbi:MAG: HlyD family efflux transporter periplasmic adaptor subunit [Sedimentisphaerales bacterium]